VGIDVRTEVGATFGIRTEVGIPRSALKTEMRLRVRPNAKTRVELWRDDDVQKTSRDRLETDESRPRRSKVDSKPL